VGATTVKVQFGFISTFQSSPALSSGRYDGLLARYAQLDTAKEDKRCQEPFSILVVTHSSARVQKTVPDTVFFTSAALNGTS